MAETAPVAETGAVTLRRKNFICRYSLRKKLPAYYGKFTMCEIRALHPVTRTTLKA